MLTSGERSFSNKQPNFKLKGTRKKKKEAAKPKVSGRKKIICIRAEINGMET